MSWQVQVPVFMLFRSVYVFTEPHKENHYLFAQIQSRLLLYRFFISSFFISSPVSVHVVYLQNFNLCSNQYNRCLTPEIRNFKSLFFKIKSDKSISKNVLSIPRYECTGGGISCSQAIPVFHAFIHITML